MTCFAPVRGLSLSSSALASLAQASARKRARLRVDLPTARASARPSARSAARAAAARGRHVRCGGDHGRRRARSRIARRRSTPRAAQDAARQRRRAARAAHGAHERVRPLSRLRGRSARECRSLRRPGLVHPGAGTSTRRVCRAHEHPQPQLRRRAACAPSYRGAGCRGTGNRVSPPHLRRPYTPQDRLAEVLVARRPSLTSSSAISLLANLGMSTQLAAFGLLTALGYPLAFAWLMLAELAAIGIALLPRSVPRRRSHEQRLRASLPRRRSSP